MILAGFFDINNNGLDVADIGTICGVIGAIAIATRWIVRHLVKQIHDIVVEEVNRATYLISPKANGGLSLPDVARETYKNAVITQAIADHLGIDLKEK